MNKVTESFLIFFCGFVAGKGTECLVSDNEETKEIEINLEDAARGLGFTRTEIKSGKTYTSILWHRVKQYLADVDFRTEVCESTYIPEAVFYMLAMKASNEAARKFQRWIAYEVIPNIRKHGVHMTPAAIEKVLSDPDFIIGLATELKTARQELRVKDKQIAALIPKATYCEVVLQAKNTVNITQIAKDYGYSGTSFNKLLHKLGVQYKQGGVWYLYQTYAGLGWATSKLSKV